MIASDSVRQARHELRKLGLQVLKISQTTSKAKSSFSLSGLYKRSWNHWVAGFTGELATLVSVGVPLLEALETLTKQYKGKANTIVLRLKDDVSSGTSFAEAMQRQPEVFDNLCVKLLEVGQNTGKLDEILRQVSEFKRRSHEFKDRLLSAVLYPAIILLVSVGVSIFLMTVVVPMLLENLADTGKQLPWPTLILQKFSLFLNQHGWSLGLLALFSGIASLVYIKTEPGRRLRDRLMIKVPVLGIMGRKQEISRVSLVIATLMKSGVEFVDAIKIAKGTTRNILLTEALEECSIQVESGKDIGMAMADSPYFPPLVNQVFTVGQQSGRLEEMLFQLSSDYDKQVESIAGRLSTVIEPALILILSGFIGFIMLATLLPMMEAGNVF